MGVVKAKSRRVISVIRETLGGQWKYNRQLHRWMCNDGREVIACAVLAPKYDGDDDTFRTVYYLKCADGTTRAIHMGWAL